MTTDNSTQALIEQARGKQKLANMLVAKADKSPLDADDIQAAETLSSELTALHDEIQRRKVAEGQQMLNQLGEAGKKITNTGDIDESRWGGKPGPVQQGTKTGFMRLKSDAPATAGRLVGEGRPKALLTEGSSVTGVAIDQDIIELGRPAGSILDVLPVAIRTAGPNYRYLQQATRSNAAAVVAAGATKPTSTYTIDSVDGSLQVVAHVSEAVDTYLLSDMAGGLEAFIANEMGYGLNLAVESLVLTTVDAASGTSTQAFASDVLTTTRSAVTKLQVAGVDQSFWFMSPADWQEIEMWHDANGRFYAPAVAPVELAGRRLWSAPVVVSTAATTGSAHLFGQGAAQLSTDNQLMLRWSEINDDFEKNQVRARMESRFNPDVLRPWAIVKVALTDDDSSSS